MPSSIGCIFLYALHRTNDASFTNRLAGPHVEILNDAMDKRNLSLKARRVRCLVALLAGATIERVGGKSTLFKMKIDIFRELLAFLPLN